jgi:hypothetical protein
MVRSLPKKNNPLVIPDAAPACKSSLIGNASLELAPLIGLN